MKKLFSLPKKLTQVFSSIFGTFNWNSPTWVKQIKTQAKKKPLPLWGALSFILILFLAAGAGLYWYQHRPQPLYVTAAISIPEITPLAAEDEPLQPNNLVIDFGIKQNGFQNQPVAPLQLVGKTINSGLSIKPQIAGEWNWNNDSQLIFIPKEDWSAGQKYRLHFDKKFFNNKIPMEAYDFSFTTKPFEAKIESFKLVQDPINPEKREAVASIQFNYPVNPQSLEKNTDLSFQSLKDTAKQDKLNFSYTYDKHHRLAYLHSATLAIKDVARYLLLTLNQEVSSANDSTELKSMQSAKLLLPDASNFLNIAAASASIIRNSKDRPEQILTIETSIGVSEKEFNQAIHLYLLPQDYPQTASEAVKKDYQWQNPGEVNSRILSLATPLSREALPAEQNYSLLHSFKFKAETPRYIYLKIDKGMKGAGNFTLNADYQAIIPVPSLPKEIAFLHSGSLLALSGEKKLSVLVRGLEAVKFDFARVLPANINFLVTQTQGNFNNPYFINPSFNQQNISQIFSQTQTFDASDLSKQQYTALDLGTYLNKEAPTSESGGLFLLQARGWDEKNQAALDVKASRLILITDLGMLVKDNNDGSHDVFINSIAQGSPLAKVTVSVLGKNGLAILSQVSDDQGRVHFPSLKDYVEDKEPVAYLASLNKDVSFIPFNHYNRQLNFSKFDVGGLYTSSQELNSLSAYLFTDRGIYRPGDTVHIGMIVKQGFAQAQPAGLPLEATITDSRGITVKDQKLSLNENGYLEMDFKTQAHSPTGQYTLNLFLVRDKHPQNLLGSTSIRIAEFQPDRMRISSKLVPKPSEGWSSPLGLKAKVTLWNLYGAPAANRRIKAQIILRPQAVHFSAYPDTIFADPLQDPKKPNKTFTETLSELHTNDKGEAEFDLKLDKFEKATYQLTFFAEGFEAEGGRSVNTQTQTLISPLPYFIGYKPDGDLSFIKQNSTRSIHYIAVNPQLSKESPKDLKIQLSSLHPVTSLIKKADGTYQYQSIIQARVIKTEPLNFNEEGLDYSLSTEEIGDYTLKILDKDNTLLSQLKYTVVGASQQPLAKNAELTVKLNKSEYKANEDIILQLTAPYTGSGLITIERDKVYASQWFKTDTTNSVQSIHLPADFKGNAYINVAFIRDWKSSELFLSPLSYAVVPFSVTHEDQELKINLNTVQTARPGEALKIAYQTDKPAQIIVFAVDEGILQVSRYLKPDPLAFFFQKRALEVLTQQTVDQILPEFIQSRELSAAGGDAGEESMASRLNPFKRKTDLPVVFWSGLVDADATPRELTYQIPDYFNGTLKIMAVAVSTNSLGSAEKALEVRGDFIINPNVPPFVAPGDEFEISSSIANNIKDSGEHTPVTISLSVSPELELLDQPSQTIEIAERQEQVVHFRLRAKSVLGSAKLRFKAQANSKEATMDATLSVRPAMPLVNDIQSSSIQASQVTLDLLQSFYPQYRNASLSLSTNPLILIFGLKTYVEHYPYGCTEQLVSKTFPLLVMSSLPWFVQDKQQLDEQINTRIQLLSQRQTAQGSFSYWPGVSGKEMDAFSSVYAMHFLTEAREQRYEVSADLFSNGLNYLKQLAGQNVSDLNAARTQAYALYVLTRNEIITTPYLANLQLYLDKSLPKTWQKDLTAVYMAASYHLLKNTDDAEQLIRQYQPQAQAQGADYSDFYDRNINNAQFIYIVAKHFPKLLPHYSETLLPELIKAMNQNELNTLFSSYSALALAAYPQKDTPQEKDDLSVTQINLQKEKIQAPSSNTDYQKLLIAEDIKQIRINNPSQKLFFYQLIQSGFDKKLPTQPLKQGLEIFREYRDKQGQVIHSAPLGSEIEVHIQIRADDFQTNIAIEDLLPGGFEVVRDSVKADLMDFVDIREDRVNYFGPVETQSKELVYKIKAVNPGTYKVPPPYAEAMYHPDIKALGLGSEFTITKP